LQVFRKVKEQIGTAVEGEYEGASVVEDEDEDGMSTNILARGKHEGEQEGMLWIEEVDRVTEGKVTRFEGAGPLCSGWRDCSSTDRMTTL
jgi:hypothetical protein